MLGLLWAGAELLSDWFSFFWRLFCVHSRLAAAAVSILRRAARFSAGSHLKPSSSSSGNSIHSWRCGRLAVDASISPQGAPSTSNLWPSNRTRSKLGRGRFSPSRFRGIRAATTLATDSSFLSGKFAFEAPRPKPWARATSVNGASEQSSDAHKHLKRRLLSKQNAP